MKKLILLLLIGINLNSFASEKIHFDMVTGMNFDYDVIKIKKARGLLVVNPSLLCPLSDVVSVEFELEIVGDELLKVVGSVKEQYKKAKDQLSYLCQKGSEAMLIVGVKYDSQSTMVDDGYENQYLTLDFMIKNESLYIRSENFMDDEDYIPYASGTPIETTGINLMAYKYYREAIVEYVDGKIDPKETVSKIGEVIW